MLRRPRPPSPGASGGRLAAAPAAYDIGDPTLSELYVAPAGDDANSGASPAAPLRTLSAAWGRLPTTTSLTGYRISLASAITYACYQLLLPVLQR
jgi:hypothetical protein